MQGAVDGAADGAKRAWRRKAQSEESKEKERARNRRAQACPPLRAAGLYVWLQPGWAWLGTCTPGLSIEQHTQVTVSACCASRVRGIKAAIEAQLPHRWGAHGSGHRGTWQRTQEG